MKGRNLYLMSLMVLALAASSYAQTTVCIPQFVDGESDAVRWRTTLILIEPGADAGPGSASILRQ